MDCTNKGKDASQRDKVCRFNIDDLGAQCTWQQDYGYDEGTPCVILKFNKVSKAMILCFMKKLLHEFFTFWRLQVFWLHVCNYISNRG